MNARKTYWEGHGFVSVKTWESEPMVTGELLKNGEAYVLLMNHERDGEIDDILLTSQDLQKIADYAR